MNELYNEITVKTEYKGNFGSGCLYNPPDSEFTYIITAKHCLGTENNINNGKIIVSSIKKEEICNDDIKISRHISRSRWDDEFVVKEIYLANEEIDLAILIINRIEIKNNFKLLKPKGKCDYEVFIYGYPKALFENKQHPTQKISEGKITEVYEDGQVEFIVTKLETFEGDAKEALNSFSGSGIFTYVDKENQLYYIGTYTSLKHVQGTYSSLIGESISNLEEVIIYNEIDELDIIFDEVQINNINNFTTLKEWEQNNLSNSTNWVDIETSLTIIEFIKKHFNSHDGNNIKYIIGDSGSGKTRAVLQACKSDKKYESVMYFERYSNIDFNIINKLKFNPDTTYYIVIDDVDLYEWDEINRRLSNNANIRTILIGVVPSNRRSSNIDIYYKTAPTQEEIGLILKNNSLSLNEDEINNIITLSQNDLRFALLVKELHERERGKSLVSNAYMGYLSMDSIYKRIIKQYEAYLGNKEDFISGYSKLCMLIETGFKGEHENEIEILADCFKIEKYKLFNVIEKASVFSLGQKKYEFFEPYPRVLAKYIFEQEVWPSIKYEIKFYMDSMTEIMKKRFINRVEECGKEIREEVSEALAAWFLDTFIDNNLDLIDDERKAKIFSVYTEFSPEIGLEWILNSLKKSIRDNADIKEMNHKARRYIIWLVEHLASFKEYFYLCEEILFILAQNETEIGLGNNSKATWGGLFLVSLSNTEIPFNHRYPLFLKRMDEIAISNIDMIEQVIISVFNNGNIARIVPPKVIGGRIVPESWNPKDYIEYSELRLKFLDELLQKITILKVDKFEMIINYLIENITTFIICGEGDKIIRYLLDEIKIDESKLVLLRSNLNNYLYSLKLVDKKGSNNKIELITNWLDEIKPITLEEEFLTLINLSYWRIGNNDHFDREQIITEFAKELLKNKLDLKKFNHIFHSSLKDITTLNQIIRKIGEIDIDGLYMDYTIDLLKNNLLNSIVLNYMFGCKNRQGFINLEFLGLLEEYKYIYSDYILNITSIVDVSDNGFRRTIDIIGNGIQYYNILANYRYKEWNDFLDEPMKVELLKAIRNSLNEEHRNIIILYLNNMWRNEKQSDERIKIILDVFTNVSRNFNVELSDWQENLEMIPDTYIKEKINILITTFSNTSELILEENIINIIKELGRQYSNIIVPALGKVFLDRNTFKVFYNVYRGLFESFDFDDIKQWVEQEGDNAAIAIARHLNSPEPTSDDNMYVPKLTEWILEKFETNDRVFREFICGRHSMQVFNVDEKISNHENLVKRMEPYLKHRLRRIREWAEYEINDSQNLIKDTNNRRVVEQREY